MTYKGRFVDSMVVDQLDKIALSFLVEDLEIRRGGVAANIAFGMANLGQQPILVAAAGVEGGDLRHVFIGGAHETGRVQGLGDVHRVTVDPVALQPGSVLHEILAGRCHQDRLLPQVGHAERDVGGDPPAADLEVLHQEGQGDLVELVDDHRVGESTLVGHQVVSGDGSCNGNTHAGNLPRGSPVLESAAKLLPVSVTDWYVFPLSDNRNTVVP